MVYKCTACNSDSVVWKNKCILKEQVWFKSKYENVYSSCFYLENKINRHMHMYSSKSWHGLYKIEPAACNNKIIVWSKKTETETLASIKRPHSDLFLHTLRFHLQCVYSTEKIILQKRLSAVAGKK